MIPITQADQLIIEVVGNYRLPTETIKTIDAFQRIISKNQYAKLDLPPFNKSAMDGYAILANDNQETYQLLETVAAGETASQPLRPGTTIKVMTGAPVPENTARVIPIELTESSGETIKILSKDKVDHICKQGEDIKKDQLVLQAGKKLGSIEIANLIACGITEIEVYQSPKITIISTGDEIIDNFADFQPGKIMNSNGPLLQTVCLKHYFSVTGHHHVLDNLDKTIETLKKALAESDIVIFSGGVSMGDFDYVTEAIKQVGATIHFNRLAIKPGKPTTFASLDHKFIFGLPGNPVAVYLTFHLFVLPLIQLITEQTKHIDHWPSFALAKTFTRKKADRTGFIPCQLTSDYTILPIEHHGSAHLLALLECSGFFTVPEGQTKIEQNTKVHYVSFKND